MKLKYPAGMCESALVKVELVYFERASVQGHFRLVYRLEADVPVSGVGVPGADMFCPVMMSFAPGTGYSSKYGSSFSSTTA